MDCSKCFSKNPLPWIAALVPFLVCTVFVGPSFSPLLFTVSFVIASSSILSTFSRHKPVLVEASVEDDDPALTSDKEAQAGGGLAQVEGSTVRSPDPFSEGETIDQHSSITTEQDSEVDWSYSGGNVGCQTLELDCSDDDDYSISGEESLIEIALPSGHYVDPRQEESDQFNLQQKFPDFSPNSIFKQHSLMELLADINEEDSLIEIDISMGSIKCSRFEMEA